MVLEGKKPKYSEENGGMVLTEEKPKYSEENMSQCNFVYHKYHMDMHVVETGSLGRETGE
jgi:hypothetical protein